MFKDIKIYCDKPTDAKLLKFLKHYSTSLSKIPDINIDVLPDRKSLTSQLISGFGELLNYDRADFYFCYKGYPFFVIEMTEHGYTGDNCLQRFARITKTAEMRIPFIYFAPTSRTRYDELSNENPSYRNVSSDLYLGFTRLSEIYSTPVIAVEWKTGSNGIPLVLGADAPNDTGIAELFLLIDDLFENYLNDLIEHKSILNVPEIKKYIELTNELSLRENVRDSEVRYEYIDFNNIVLIINKTSKMFNIIPKEYFFKGKSHKLLALMAIKKSKITKAILPNNKEISIKEFFELYGKKFEEYKWLYYYSGYQWRSEPNVGIVMNIDITCCRKKDGKTIFDRDQLICVHWPRIFWDKNSKTRDTLLNQLSNKNSDSEFNKLVKEAEEFKGNSVNINFIQESVKAFGSWNDKATVARIYRDACDLVILNDAIIVGNKWSKYES